MVRIGRRELAVGAPQERADTGEQLAEAVGLGDVLVGAHLEPERDVHLVRLDGEHEDRRAHPGAAELATHVEARSVGEPDVEDEEMRVGAPCVRDGALGRALAMDLVALAPDPLHEGLGDGRVVLDHQDPHVGVHRRRL